MKRYVWFSFPAVERDTDGFHKMPLAVLQEELDEAEMEKFQLYIIIFSES